MLFASGGGEIFSCFRKFDPLNRSKSSCVDLSGASLSRLFVVGEVFS